MRSAVGPAAAVLPDCLCVPGLMDELARQAEMRAGVDIAEVLQECNAAAFEARDATAIIINHADTASSSGGGNCAMAARERAVKQGGTPPPPRGAYAPEATREREREMERMERNRLRPPPPRRPSVTDTTVAIGTAIVVDEPGSFTAALAEEYPAVVKPNPPAARSASGTGAALIENGVFDMYAGFHNVGQSLQTAAMIWTERAARQHMEQQRRERATQAVFLKRMSTLMMEASDDLEASASGVPISPQYEGYVGGGSGRQGVVTAQGGRVAGTGGVENAPESPSPSSWWPLWTWEGMFATP